MKKVVRLLDIDLSIEKFIFKSFPNRTQLVLFLESAHGKNAQQNVFLVINKNRLFNIKF